MEQKVWGKDGPSLPSKRMTSPEKGGRGLCTCRVHILH
ncbi:MC010 [Molluscum contagiosum virus subtype 1]|nr:MC010 [Molluscum contagiosum virus subtype 1]